ncbi:hypothetical protein ACF0H5_018394 [Mactra antiquata]
MSFILDYEALEAAELECMERMENHVPKQGHCNVTWDLMLCWDAVPSGTVAKQLCPAHVEGIRNTAFAYKECDISGKWFHPSPDSNSTSGWTNYSDCFRPDPEFSLIKNDLSRIQLMSTIGYAISLVSLTVAVLIMLLLRRLHCKSNILHINLFLSLILRATVFLTKDVLFVDGLGLAKDVIRLSPEKVVFKNEGPHWECRLFVSIFMYSIAASMMWIFMEGLYLHMLVYRTLHTERNGIRMYVFAGWLSPILIITPWVFVRIFADNNLCWTTDDHGYIWIIKTPILVTIVANFIFFINIVYVLCLRMKTHRNVKGNNQQLRKLAKFILVLIPLFGVLYICAAVYPTGINMQADMIYLYFEMFYNSFQGLLLAILFCFLNEEVHKEIRSCLNYRIRHESMYTRTFTLSGYRKGSSVSHSISGHPHVKFTQKSSSAEKSSHYNDNDTKEQETALVADRPFC